MARSLVLEALPTLAQVQRAHIQRVLRASNFSIRRTALILGVQRATVYRQIAKYKLERREASTKERAGAMGLQAEGRVNA